MAWGLNAAQLSSDLEIIPSLPWACPLAADGWVREDVLGNLTQSWGSCEGQLSGDPGGGEGEGGSKNSHPRPTFGSAPHTSPPNMANHSQWGWDGEGAQKGVSFSRRLPPSVGV